MNALSSSAPLSKPNKYNTFQGQERTEDFDLSWYQFKWRNHDPAIGRFFNVDPLSEKFYYNSTYAFSENKVTNHIELEGLEAYPTLSKFKSGVQQVGQRFNNTVNRIGTGIRNFFTTGRKRGTYKQSVGIILESPDASGADINEKSVEDVEKVKYYNFQNFSDAKDALGHNFEKRGAKNYFGPARDKVATRGATGEAMKESFKEETSQIQIGFSGDSPVSIIIGEDTLDVEVQQVFDWTNKPGYIQELVNIYLVESSATVPDSLTLGEKNDHYKIPKGKTPLKRKLFEDERDN